jgi:hypothetical protein
MSLHVAPLIGVMAAHGLCMSAARPRLPGGDKLIFADGAAAFSVGKSSYLIDIRLGGFWPVGKFP